MKWKLNKEKSKQLVLASLGLTLILSGCSTKKTLREASIPEHTVTFINGSEVYAFQVPEGERVYAPAITYPEGYEFDAWYIDDEYLYDFNYPIYSDLTLEAKFKPIENHSLRK